jgi:hypothetical protein
MTLRDVVDRVPLPGETITGVLAALLAQRVRPLALPARGPSARPAPPADSHSCWPRGANEGR